MPVDIGSALGFQADVSGKDALAKRNGGARRLLPGALEMAAVTKRLQKRLERILCASPLAMHLCMLLLPSLQIFLSAGSLDEEWLRSRLEVLESRS